MLSQSCKHIGDRVAPPADICARCSPLTHLHGLGEGEELLAVHLLDALAEVHDERVAPRLEAKGRKGRCNGCKPDISRSIYIFIHTHKCCPQRPQTPSPFPGNVP